MKKAEDKTKKPGKGRKHRKSTSVSPAIAEAIERLLVEDTGRVTSMRKRKTGSGVMLVSLGDIFGVGS